MRTLLKFEQIDGKKGHWDLVDTDGKAQWGLYSFKSEDGKIYALVNKEKVEQKKYDISTLRHSPTWRFAPRKDTINTDKVLLLCSSS